MVSLPWMTLLPVLGLAIGAVLVLLADIVWPAARTLHLVVVAVAALVSAAATLPGLQLEPGDSLEALCPPGGGTCLYAVDASASSLQLFACIAVLVVLLLAWRDWTHGEGGRTAVLSALLLGATAGVVAIPAAGDLASLLVAIELATLPTVALVALEHRAARQPGAIDAAVALLSTSLLSFALLALGVALWFVATGSLVLDPSIVAQSSQDSAQLTLLVVAGVFAFAGLGFKLSAVPFHLWTPVTYAGAPLAVTVYLSTVSKVAALGALVVVVSALSEPVLAISGTPALTVVLGILAALSLTLGNAVALVQRDSVKLLAWSTIAQAGWVLLPLASLQVAATRAAVGYLGVYLVATLVIWIVVAGLALPPGRTDPTSLYWTRGLLREKPLLGLPLLFALLALAGLPPAVVGLVAKIAVIEPVASAGLWWLAVVAAINVALGLAVYLRWAWFLMEPAPEPAGVKLPLSWVVALLLLTAVLVALSIWPIGFL